jgi:NAD(P)-dependent dehydrogenase (short-subunit alcohol dehydrogenase family)
VEYAGRVAVVTGASSGIGRRLALDLGRAGAVVTGVARREERLAELIREIGDASPDSEYRVCDLAHVDAFLSCLRDVESRRGRIDILINVAGIGGVLRNEEPSLERLREQLEVNFVAPYAAMLAVLPGMRARGSGVIANVSSDDARAPGPGAGDYAATKAALSAATESLAFDVRGDGVRLHVVYPAWVPTEMGLAAVREGGLPMPPKSIRRTEQQVSAVVLRRLGGPRIDINAAALPLVAPLVRTVAPLTYQRMRAKR